MSSVLQRGLTIAATAFVLAFCSRTAISQSTWTKAAVFPEPEEELDGVTANGKMYVIGGYGLGSPRGFVYEYDPAGDKWTKKKPMARPAHHSALVEYRGKIYVFGGFVPPPSGP